MPSQCVIARPNKHYIKYDMLVCTDTHTRRLFIISTGARFFSLSLPFFRTPLSSMPLFCRETVPLCDVCGSAVTSPSSVSWADLWLQCILVFFCLKISAR